MSQPNVDDRLLAAVRDIIRTELERFEYAGLFQYSIKAVSGAPPSVTIDCSPTDPTIGLPDLVRLPMQPDISGITSLPTVGLDCVVAFLNRDPGLPRIVGVGSMGVTPIARLGDSIQITSADILAATMVAGSNPVTVSLPLMGTIVSGSGKAFTG